MKIEIVKEENFAKILIEGRIDIQTAGTFDKEIRKVMKKINNICLDFKKVEYITSAGLRVILAVSKELNGKGKLTIINTSSLIKEIFDMTGFSEVVEVD